MRILVEIQKPSTRKETKICSNLCCSCWDEWMWPARKSGKAMMNIEDAAIPVGEAFLGRLKTMLDDFSCQHDQYPSYFEQLAPSTSGAVKTYE